MTDNSYLQGIVAKEVQPGDMTTNGLILFQRYSNAQSAQVTNVELGTRIKNSN